MGRPRFSISRLMFLIALLSLDCLILRGGFSEDGTRPHALAYHFGLIVLASQVGVERAIYGSSRRRPFWVGFVAAGLLGATSPYWGLGFVSETWSRLIGWEDGAVAGLARRFPALMGIYRSPALHFLAGSLMFFLPPLALGLIGGLVATGLARRRRGHHDGRGEGGPPDPSPRRSGPVAALRDRIASRLGGPGR